MHVHQTGVGGVTVSPDLLKEHLTGEDLPRLAGERDQQVELQRSEGNGLPVPLHRMPGHIYDQVTDGQLLRCRFLGPTQTCPDPGNQLLRFERLDDVVVGP